MIGLNFFIVPELSLLIRIILLCQLFTYVRISQTANKHVIMKSSWARCHAPKFPDSVLHEAERSLKTINSKLA